MTRLSILSALSLYVLLPTALALPHFWPHGYGEKPYPTLTISSIQGVYPTGSPGTTGTGTGTAYYPTSFPYPTYTPTGASGTGTGVAYPTYAVNKRDVDAAHEEARRHFEGPRKHDSRPYYPYAPGYSCSGTAGPTGTGTAIYPTGSGVMPTGTLPMPTGTVIIPSGTVGGGYYSTIYM